MKEEKIIIANLVEEYLKNNPEKSIIYNDIYLVLTARTITGSYEVTYRHKHNDRLYITFYISENMQKVVNAVIEDKLQEIMEYRDKYCSFKYLNSSSVFYDAEITKQISGVNESMDIEILSSVAHLPVQEDNFVISKKGVKFCLLMGERYSILFCLKKHNVFVYITLPQHRTAEGLHSELEVIGDSFEENTK